MGSAPPPARRREILLRLDAGEGKGWRRRIGAGGGGSPDDGIRLVGTEIVFTYADLLQAPLTIPAGMVTVATVDRGRSTRGREDFGRFPVLHRMGPKTVVPVEEGVEGWLWTSGSGSALPALGDAVPNLALVFIHPLDEALVRASFRPKALVALAERSALGVPAVPGLLARVADASLAERAFGELGVDGPLTDREVAPAQRRHLPSDRPANPAVRFGDQGREQTSVPPPGG